MKTLQRFATVCYLGAAFTALVSACGSSDPTTSTGVAGAGSASAGAPSAGAPSADAPSAGAPSADAPSADAPSAGAAGAETGGGGSGLTGDAANGMTVYSSASTNCATCHGAMGEGSIGPNITGSKTAGIGNWTQAQFHEAVRNAKDKSGANLNTAMVKFYAATISDQDIADVYAFLMSKTDDTANAGSACTTAGACKGTH